MARDVIVRLVCDLCSDDTEAHSTVQFAPAAGELFELDLCRAHEEEFDGVMARWQAAGRRADAAERASQPAQRRRRAADRKRLRAIREWAKSNGFPDLSERGRLPSDVLTAYERAHSS